MASHCFSSQTSIEPGEVGIGHGGGVRRGIFLDRDGVLNGNIWNSETHAFESPLVPEQFELLPKVVPALQLLQDAGYLLFLVSNQPNHAKGKATMQTLEAIHNRLETTLTEASISFSAYYYCFHHPAFTGQCICRKPLPHFLWEARERHGVNLENSWMIGDRDTDIQCGRAAGARTVEITPISTSKCGADYVAADLWSAANFITLQLGR